MWAKQQSSVMLSRLAIVTVTLADSEDGGLHVYSDELPGLILSGNGRQDVISKIVPAIQALFEHKGIGKVISVRAARPLSEVFKSASPRDMDLQIQHEQFVVELTEAA
jgi:predicted RNase H-like HicB family nuclease